MRRNLFINLFLSTILIGLLFLSCKKNDDNSSLEEVLTHKNSEYERNGSMDSLKEGDEAVIIDKKTGIFSIGNKVIELEPSTEEKFNDACLPVQKYLSSSLCKNIKHFERCCEIYEKHLLTHSNAPVRRQGANLIVQLNNGKIISFLNKINQGNQEKEIEDEYVLFVFADYFPSLQAVIIDKFYYEGGESLLIDLENGDEIHLFGDVKLSPDGKKIVSYSCDPVAGYRANGIQILHKDSKTNKFECILNLDFVKFGPENVCWLNNHQLVIKQVMLNNNGKVNYSYAILNFKELI